MSIADTPRFFKPRSVSYYLKEKVEQELARLQDDGMISPVRFSDWAAPIVPVVKNDGLFASVEIIKLQQIWLQNKTPTHCHVSKIYLLKYQVVGFSPNWIYVMPTYRSNSTRNRRNLLLLILIKVFFNTIDFRLVLHQLHQFSNELWIALYKDCRVYQLI